MLLSLVLFFLGALIAVFVLLDDAVAFAVPDVPFEVSKDPDSSATALALEGL